LRPSRALDIGGEEDMRDAARTLKGFEGLRSVKQIDRNVLVPAFDIRFATGDGDHVPVVQSKKVAQKISAPDSRRAGNQRLLSVLGKQTADCDRRRSQYCKGCSVARASIECELLTGT